MYSFGAAWDPGYHYPSWMLIALKFVIAFIPRVSGFCRAKFLVFKRASGSVPPVEVPATKRRRAAACAAMNIKLEPDQAPIKRPIAPAPVSIFRGVDHVGGAGRGRAETSRITVSE